MNWLIAYAVLATIALGFVAIELKAERASSRMVDEFRENDRKFYRGWENIWFKQLERMAEQGQRATAKPTAKPTKKRSTK